MKIVNGFTPIFHSVIALEESGERRPILLLLCSAKYMFPEDESNATPIGPLEFVGTSHSVTVLVDGERRPILLLLCSAKYMLPAKSEVTPFISFESFLVAQLSITMVVRSVGIAKAVVVIEAIGNENKSDNSIKTKSKENNNSNDISKSEQLIQLCIYIFYSFRINATDYQIFVLICSFEARQLTFGGLSNYSRKNPLHIPQ
jgi:hypothetical protein